ncbi:MAG TPA: SRPBCC domain-containing protein [Amycolatopsis sp.]|nr:SRPBCC domain-containing protein [Amycolatopsis sp.]
MNEKELTITRVFDAPRELVFQAWTVPEQFANWMGPNGFTAYGVEMDLTEGGAWRATIGNDEGLEHTSTGVYREITAPERLVFTFFWTSAPEETTLVTVDFADLGDKTEMTFHQAEFRSGQDRDEHRAGWSETFENLTAHLIEKETNR